MLYDRAALTTMMIHPHIHQHTGLGAPKKKQAGLLTGVTSLPIVPFVAGMLAWAFLGGAIKSIIGLGEHATRAGVEAVRRKIPEPKKD